MAEGNRQKETGASDGGWFTTTQWSVVLAAGHSTAPDARQALEALCRMYWNRSSGNGPPRTRAGSSRN